MSRYVDRIRFGTVLAVVAAMAIAVACGDSTEVVEIEKQVVRTIEVERPVEVIKEVIKEVPKTVVVEKEVVKEVEVEREVVKEVEVVKEIEVEKLVLITPTPRPRRLAKVVYLNAGTEPPTLDPALATDSVSINMIENLFVGLTNFNSETWEVEPDLASSWDVSDDGTVYTFHLRDDVMWTDGSPVTAHDVVYGILRIGQQLRPLQQRRVR